MFEQSQIQRLIVMPYLIVQLPLMMQLKKSSKEKDVGEMEESNALLVDSQLSTRTQETVMPKLLVCAIDNV